MTKEELERRADAIEKRIAQAPNKELPTLNQCFQKIMERLVALDMEEAEKKNA